MSLRELGFIARRGFPICLGLLLLQLYWKTHSMDYVWDDWSLFVNSPTLRKIDGIDELWHAITQPILPGTTYFRPLVLLSFVLQFQALGSSPGVSHSINLALFIFNTGLVYWIALKIASRFDAERDLSIAPLSAGIAATLYALHPAQVEAVAWVAGRFDLLVSTFALLCIASVIACKGAVRVVLSGGFFLLALLSKEMALTLPLCAICILLVLEDEPFQFKALKTTALQLGVAFATAFMLYIAIKYMAIGKLAHVDRSISDHVSLFQRLSFIGLTSIFYLKMLFWPFMDINPQHPFEFAKMNLGSELIGCFVVLMSITGLGYLLYKRSKLSLLLFAAILSFLPVLNIIPLTIGGNIGHERFMAFPLVMFSLAIVSVSYAMYSGGRRLFAWFSSLAFGWLVLAAINTAITVPLWANDLTLWAWAYQKNPTSMYNRVNLAMAYFKFEDYASAEKLVGIDSPDGRDEKFLEIQGALDIKAGRSSEGVMKIQQALSKLQLPHEKVLSMGYAIDGVRADMRHYPDAQKVAFSYMAMAEGYKGMGDYEKSYQAAKVAGFYVADFPPGLLAQALALYGKDDWDGGQRAFAAAMESFLKEAHESAKKMRSEFIKDLCGSATPPENVCRNYSLE